MRGKFKISLAMKAGLFLLIFLPSVVFSQGKKFFIGSGLFYDHVYEFTRSLGVEFQAGLTRFKYFVPELRIGMRVLDEKFTGPFLSLLVRKYLFKDFYSIFGFHTHGNSGIGYYGESSGDYEIINDGAFNFLQFGIGTKFNVMEFELIYMFPFRRKAGVKGNYNTHKSTDIYLHGILRTSVSFVFSF